MTDLLAALVIAVSIASMFWALALTILLPRVLTTMAIMRETADYQKLKVDLQSLREKLTKVEQDQIDDVLARRR